jgi:hypothetical protein
VFQSDEEAAVRHGGFFVFCGAHGSFPILVFMVAMFVWALVRRLFVCRGWWSWRCRDGWDGSLEVLFGLWLSILFLDSL